MNVGIETRKGKRYFYSLKNIFLYSFFFYFVDAKQADGPPDDGHLYL